MGRIRRRHHRCQQQRRLRRCSQLRSLPRILASQNSSVRMGNLLNIRARHARSQMRNGIKLYQQQNSQQAIRQWKAALRRLKSVEDKFITSGYIVQAYCDSGEFEQMLYAAVEQVELANNHRDDFMKSEALLNLARANERQAEFEKAIGYAESSLALPGIDSRSPGYAHLVLAHAKMGLSNFQSSLQHFEKAMKIANSTGDKLLELQLSLGLGNLFTLMRDLNKALIFLQNALGILQGIEANHVHAKYKSAILYQLSLILCIRGRYSEGREVCEESIELAKKVGNKPIFARALTTMADICREVGETEARETITKSWACYEQAFRLLRKMNDRMGQVTVLASMAKSAAENKGVHYTGRCECQAIQLNRKCLELASLIGCKHMMMECNLRLQELYGQLADDENAEQSARSHFALVQEMELFCNFCGQRYGDTDESLQALACSHIFHERCLQKCFARIGEASTTCPKCRRRTSLMENISLSSSTAQTPANEFAADFIGSSQPGPSTSTATTSIQNAPIPTVVLCERNFDDSRWNPSPSLPSPPTIAITEMESAERQICLSTSTVSSSALATNVPFRRDSANGSNGNGQKQQLSTFAPAANKTQKENFIPMTIQMANIDVEEELVDEGEEGDKSQKKEDKKQQQLKVNLAKPQSSTSAMIGNHNMVVKRLLPKGRRVERMTAISPVAEEEEEEMEEDDEGGSGSEVRRRKSRGGRGVTEL